MDVSKPENRRRLVDNFVNSVILYDDRIEFYFNFKKGAKSLSLEDLEKGSDTLDSLPPKNRQAIACLFFYLCPQDTTSFCDIYGANFISNLFELHSACGHIMMLPFGK